MEGNQAHKTRSLGGNDSTRVYLIRRDEQGRVKFAECLSNEVLTEKVTVCGSSAYLRLWSVNREVKREARAAIDLVLYQLLSVRSELDEVFNHYKWLVQGEHSFPVSSGLGSSM